MKKQLKNMKGITLIALVITIIVLLILAGVTIATLTGDNGIITQANKAKEENKSEGLKEEIRLACEANTIKEYTTGKNLEEELNKISNATVEKLLDDTFYVERENIGYTVYEDGTIVNGKMEIWDGSSSEVPEIKEANWNIYTAGQLKFLADFVNNGNQLTEAQKTLVAEAGYEEGSITITDSTIVYLMNDIDLGARHNENGEKIAGNYWTPIGKTKELKFTGTFEGNNNTIRGICIKSTGDYIGLFGVSDTIKNLSVENGYVEGNKYVGGIVGFLGEGEVSNCKNGMIILGKDQRVGGIIGQSNTGTDILNCENTGKVTGKSSYVGGIIGLSYSSKIEYCENIGKVEGKTICVGGIAGFTGGNNSEIEYSKNSGEIYGEGERVGGITGNANPQSNILNSVNTGKVTGKGERIGGIAGYSIASIEECKNVGEIYGERDRVGGILGENDTGGRVINSENTGKVTGKGKYVGGIAGVEFGNIDQCKNSGEIYGEGESVGGIVGDLGNSTSTVIKISNSQNTGKVTGKGIYVGGIAGIIFGSVEECKNSGEIEGSNHIGGIVGQTNAYLESNIINCYNEGTVTGTGKDSSGISSVGGIIGYAVKNGTIENNYNKGQVKGINSIGGIIGRNSQTFVVRNCYNKGGLEGEGNVGGVIGKQEVNQDNLSNLYYLKTINIGAVAGTDNNEKNLKGIDDDFNDLKEFTDWLENNN